MPRQYHDAVSFCKRIAHSLEMIDLDVLIEIALVEIWHVENIEHVSREIDERRADDFFCLRLRHIQSRHHLFDRTAPLLLDQQIIQIAENPPQKQQHIIRQQSHQPTEQHQRIVQHRITCCRARRVFL